MVFMNYGLSILKLGQKLNNLFLIIKSTMQLSLIKERQNKAGTIFHSRYELLTPLGKGGYSQVWKVLDTVSDVHVAIKIFLKQDDLGIDLCKQEFKKTYDLRHDNVLRPYHFDVCNNRPYLVMPYLAGGSAVKLIGQSDGRTVKKLLNRYHQHYFIFIQDPHP